MALIIRTTGLEDYAPGGQARIKVLTVGGPSAGKTRWASYFPKPIFADCEKGRASIADRKMPYVEVLNSTDMQDLLAMLKQECRQPVAQRRFLTVVIDTLDAYQRKVKNEWMEKNNTETFTGWEAWGYLNSRMQTLMVRLLNLDMNVIVNVHFKDKTSKDDTTGKESHELMLQLQGESADTTFNDFDLVGWMGTYWEAVDGQRVEKRGLTFRKTPDKPFLKDRLYVTPPWMEVAFADSDYTNLFDAIQSRVGDLSDGEIIGEVPSEKPAPPSGFVIAPGTIGSGPIAASQPREVPFAQMDKPTLQKLARDKGLTTTVDGVPFKGNTLKSELIAALEAHANAAPATPTAKTTPAPKQSDASESAEPAPEYKVGDKVTVAGIEFTKHSEFPTIDALVQADAPAQALARVANPRRPQVVKTEAGHVNAATGELVDSPTSTSMEQAVETVETTLGGVVVAEGPPPAPDAPNGPTGAPAPVVATGPTCEECGKELVEENQDMVKLAWIKFRKHYCNFHYQERKARR